MSALVIKMLQTNAVTSKAWINTSFDEMITRLNLRRQELLNQVDAVTKNKIENVLQNKQKLDIDPNIYYEDESVNTQIDMDLDFDHLRKILDNIGNITDYQEPKYIKKVGHGLEADALLLSGYIRNITQNMKSIMRVNTDVEGLCFNYYSSNAHLTQHEKDLFKTDEYRFDILCKKMKELLGDKVEDVFIDDVGNRNSNYPLRVIDHALNESLKREPTKVSLGINPGHRIMSTLLERERSDPSDKTVEDLVWLLYDISLTAADLPLFDRGSLHHRVCKLIKLGLAIFTTTEEDDDDFVDFYDHSNNRDSSYSALSPVIGPEVD